MTEERHERGVELIRDAFKAARESGLEDWQTMTTAVLKNRLLDLTSRGFSEAEWGARDFKEFVDQFDDVLTPVPGTHPLEVRLLQELPVAAVPGSFDLGARRYIRSDLWDAVLDYSSGRKYYWDGEGAVPLEGDDSANKKLLPTLEEAEFEGWRMEFATARAGEDTGSSLRVRDWLSREEPLAELPKSLRVPWLVELKGRVFQRLSAWFEAEGIDAPKDLVVQKESRRQGDVEILRNQVIATVRGMSRAELESLMLPATSLWRSRS